MFTVCSCDIGGDERVAEWWLSPWRLPDSDRPDSGIQPQGSAQSNRAAPTGLLM